MARARAIDTRLEKLIPSTDELFVAGILTKEEIQQLVKDRTFHEYKLVARPLLLLDVKNAINYELAIEKKIAAYCAEFNRQAALEASGVDENGKKKKKSGAPAKKLQLKHRWAVQERIESIYRIGLRHLFTQRKAASLMQLKRKSTLTTAPLTGVSKAGDGSGLSAASDPIDDYELLRRECVSQLRAFSRQVSLSRLYAEWLTRSPQDAFLWSEAALFEAQNGRNDEARAIIQQAIATLRQSTSLNGTSMAGQMAQATSSIAVKLAGKDFIRQKASEEAKEVWGTALLIEILFAKKLLEGAIEGAVRNDDKTPAESLRNENVALAAIVLDMALAEAIVSDAAQTVAGEKNQMPFLCPDLGLHLYSVAVCHQFTAGLCRSILLQTLVVATNNTKASSATALNNVGGANDRSPLSALLTELFLTEIRFTATNCVTAEQFITEKTLGDLALLQTRSNGDELKREWVVRHLHRKHRVVTIREKKEKVLSSVGAALTLIIATQTAEKSLATLSQSDIAAIVSGGKKSDDEDDDTPKETANTTSLATALIRAIIASAARAGAAAAASTLANLRGALSDAVLELMSLSRDLTPIHLDDAQDALSAFEDAVREEKAARKALKEKKQKSKKNKNNADETDNAAAEEDDEEDITADPDAFVNNAMNNAMFLFTQSESSKILRVVLLLETIHGGATTVVKPLALVAVMSTAAEAAVTASYSAVANKKEAAATLELYRELCTAAALLTAFASSADAANAAEGKAAATAGKKGAAAAAANTVVALSAEEEKIERANRRIIVKVGSNGAALLKSFAEVAFNNTAANGEASDVTTTIAQQSIDLSAAADGVSAAGSDADAFIDAAFDEDVSPIVDTNAAAGKEDEEISLTAIAQRKTVFARDALWWSAGSASTATASSLIDTRFLSVRMSSADLVTFLNVAQPGASSSSAAAAAAPSTPGRKSAAASAAPAAPVATVDITTREEVAVHISRVLALIDNEAAIAAKNNKAAAEAAVAAASPAKKKGAAAEAAAVVAVKDTVVPKIAAAIQLLVCTPHHQQQKSSSSSSSASAGTYLPYDPSLWRLFAALQHTLAARIRTYAADADEEEDLPNNNKLTSSSAIGSKTARADDSSDSDDEDKKKAAVPKKKLRIGNNGATATSAAASSGDFAAASTATSVITQRDSLNDILVEILAVINGTAAKKDAADEKKALVSLSRRLYHVSLQIIAGGCAHASLPTTELRVERLKGILALTTVEIIREMEMILERNATSAATRLGFNAPAIFVGAQVLRFQQLLGKVAANANTKAKVHALLTQLTRVHNLLLAPIRILENEGTTDALGHGYSTPITRALLRNLLIPAYAATHCAAAAVEKSVPLAANKVLLKAAEKVLHSLIAQLTSLYIVEVKEAGKFGNGIRNSSQYAVVQKKDVSDHIVQNRSEVFLPFFFPATDGGFAAAPSVSSSSSSSSSSANAAVTKANIINAQVNDWLLALVFEQQYTKDLKEAMAMHARAVQSVEAPQTFLAAVSAGSLPTLF